MSEPAGNGTPAERAAERREGYPETAALGGAPGRPPAGEAAGGGSGPLPAWLDETAGDFGAPQAVIDALVVRLGVQPMARLIADRPALRAALLAEYRRQSAAMRGRLLYEEWHP
jgi:hypothetical protein